MVCYSPFLSACCTHFRAPPSNSFQNWIFCIENKFFASALFEYYLDRFSNTTNRGYVQSSLGELSGERDLNESNMTATLDTMRTMSMTMSRPNIWSKTLAFNHPDAWTLEYIALNSESIATAIDRDKSGYIRISEVNAFTDQIPTGWNLPQWCAYVAAGISYYFL